MSLVLGDVVKCLPPFDAAMPNTYSVISVDELGVVTLVRDDGNATQFDQALLEKVSP